MSGNRGIPQRARRSESMTGAEALIDLLVSPAPASKPNCEGVDDNGALTSGGARINVSRAPSSGSRPDRLAEASPLSPRRSKAVAALSGLAGLTGFSPEAAAMLSNASASISSLASATGKGSGTKAKGKAGKASSAKKKKPKAGSASATSKRKHGSGPAHKPGADGTENVGRWTTEEHNRFLKGLEIFKKDWKNIAALVGSRTVVQTRTHAQKYFQKLFKAAAAEVGATGGGAVPISTSLKGKGKKAGKTKGSGKSKTAKAKPAKSKNKSAKLTAASTPGDKARVSDPLNSPQAMVVAAAAAAVTGVLSDSALAHPHLSMAMSGTANEPKGVPRGGFGSDGVTSMLAAANAAVTGQMAGYHPLGSSRNAQGLLSTGALNPFSLPGPLGAPIPMYPGFNNGTHFGLSLVNDQASLSNSGLAEDGAGEGADFGSMLPDSFTPSSSAPPGAAKDSVAASNDAIAMSPQRRSKSAKQNGKKSNKRVRDADNSTDAVAQKTPVAGSGNPERTHPLKQRKLMGTTPGLSLSISARRGTSTSPLLKHTPLSPWVSQVKKLPAPSRTASVRFSADADVISGNKSQDGSLSTKRSFSYEANAGTDKTASGIDGNKGLSRSGFSSKASPSAAASPSSTPVWSTAASRASENNAFLKHGSLRFNNGGGAGRAHRSLSSSSSSTTSSSLSSSSSSQVAVSWRRNYQSRQRTALHTAVASGNITTVRAILSKIASQGGVLHSPMPSPTKGEVHQQDVPSMRQENPVMHVNSAVVEAVNRPDKFGYTPLMVAVTLGFTGKTASSPRSRSSSSNSSPKVSQGSAATGTGSGVAAGSETSATSASEVHFSIGLMMCAILLNVEANPFLSDDAGMTAIHWASQAGDAQVLQFLLVRCSEKLTSSLLKPIATGEPLKEIVAIMDSAEASAKAFAEGWQARDASTRSSGDDSSAIARDKMPSLEQVLSVTCRAGDTALHIAARQANVECISVLFEAGASLLKRNYACETPYDVIASALASDTKAQQRFVTKLRAKCREQFFALYPSHRTLFLSHEDCLDHKPRSEDEWESPARIEAIFDALKDSEFSSWLNTEKELEMREDFDKANVETLSRVHHAEYIRFIHDLSKQVAIDGRTVPFTPKVQKHLTSLPLDETKDSDDCDTSFSKGSLRAARRAVGAVTFAIDRVLAGKNRNAFCAVRPPGHHAGLKGLIKGATSCGFCIFNNIAAGAFHALEKHGLQRVAIVDLDVHHGNGTQEIVSTYAEPNQVFFFSVHLYDHTPGVGRDSSNGAGQYEFYPGTGSRDRLEHNVVNAPLVPMWRKERGRDNDGKKSRGKKGRSSGVGRNRARRRRVTRPLRRAGRGNFRQTISDRLVPALRAFNPELILLSSGFDGANGDVGNCLKTGARGNDTPGIDLAPSDFFWATKQIQEVAAVCCEGRIVSVLEGGYGVQKRRTSSHAAGLDRTNFARCVMSQIAGLVDHRMGRLQYGATMGDQSSDDEPLPSAATKAGMGQSDSDMSADEGQGSFNIVRSEGPPPPAMPQESEE